MILNIVLAVNFRASGRWGKKIENGCLLWRLTHRPPQIQCECHEFMVNQEQRSDETYFQWGERLGFSRRALAKLKNCDEHPGLAASMSPNELEKMEALMYEESTRSAKRFFRVVEQKMTKMTFNKK